MGLPGTVEGYYIIELLILSSSSLAGICPASVHSQRASRVSTIWTNKNLPKPMEADDRLKF
jgi:hypothetical protein